MLFTYNVLLFLLLKPRRGAAQSARQPSSKVSNDLSSAVHISNRCFEPNRPLTCDAKITTTHELATPAPTMLVRTARPSSSCNRIESSSDINLIQ